MANNNIPINDKIDYNKIFCDAVDTIVSKRLENVSFDNTVTAEIIDATNAEFGHYVVREKDITYDVMSENHSYKTGDKVYVTIPGGDYNKTKVILSEYKDKEQLAALTLVQPKDIQIQSALCSNVDISNISLAANDVDKTKCQEIYSFATDNGANVYTQLLLCDSLIFSVDIKCALRATYRYIFEGEYGLKLLLQNGDDVDSRMEIGVLDFSSLIGDPYFYPSYFTQQFVLDLRPWHKFFSRNSKLFIESFQNGEFKYKDEENKIYYVDTITSMSDALTQTRQYFGSAGEALAAMIIANETNSTNICFNNLSLSIGFNITQKNDTFNMYHTVIDQEHKILPVWCHYDDNGTEIGFTDNEDLNYNTFFAGRNQPLNAHWGTAEFRSWQRTNDYDEKTYNEHLIALQNYNKNKIIAHQEFNQEISETITDTNIKERAKKLLDTKEFLSLYTGHKALTDKIKTWINSIDEYFTFLSTNAPSKYLLENSATPILLSDTSTYTTGAQCQLHIAGTLDGTAVQLNVELKMSNGVDDSYNQNNVLYLSFKYPKNLLSFKELQSVDGIIPTQITTQNLNELQINWSNIFDNSSPFLRWAVLNNERVNDLNDNEELFTMIYYNQDGIGTSATTSSNIQNISLRFENALQINTGTIIPIDSTPITLIGNSHPNMNVLWSAYGAELDEEKINLDSFRTCPLLINEMTLGRLTFANVDLSIDDTIYDTNYLANFTSGTAPYTLKFLISDRYIHSDVNDDLSAILPTFQITPQNSTITTGAATYIANIQANTTITFKTQVRYANTNDICYILIKPVIKDNETYVLDNASQSFLLENSGTISCIARIEKAGDYVIEWLYVANPIDTSSTHNPEFTISHLKFENNLYINLPSSQCGYMSMVFEDVTSGETSYAIGSIVQDNTCYWRLTDINLSEGQRTLYIYSSDFALESTSGAMLTIECQNAFGTCIKRFDISGHTFQSNNYKINLSLLDINEDEESIKDIYIRLIAGNNKLEETEWQTINISFDPQTSAIVTSDNNLPYKIFYRGSSTTIFKPNLINITGNTNLNIICWATSFARQFALVLGVNNITFDDIFNFDPNFNFDSFIPIYTDIKKLFTAIVNQLKAYSTDEWSCIKTLKTQQPWVIDSHKFLFACLAQGNPLNINPINWQSDNNNKITLPFWPELACQNLYINNINQFYEKLSTYCHALLEQDNEYVGYCPTEEGLIAWDNIRAEILVKQTALNNLYNEILNYIYCYMPIPQHYMVGKPTDRIINLLKLIGGYSSYNDFKSIRNEVQNLNEKDFEFEFSKFLTFFSNHYYILGYRYSGVGDNVNNYLLGPNWQIDNDLTNNLNSLINSVPLDRSWNMITLNDTTAAIRAILFYNHIAYKSNIITLEDFNEETIINQNEEEFELNDQLPLFNTSKEIIGYIKGVDLIDFISRYTSGVGGA